MREKLQTLPLAELKEIAKSQGIKGISGMKKGVLVPPVAGQVQPAQQGIVPVQAGDDRPGLVPGAVVDKEHPALGADFSGVHQGSQLVPQPPGGLGKDFLLVEAGDDDVKGVAAHGRDLQKLWAFSSGI